VSQKADSLCQGSRTCSWQIGIPTNLSFARIVAFLHRKIYYRQGLEMRAQAAAACFALLLQAHVASSGEPECPATLPTAPFQSHMNVPNFCPLFQRPCTPRWMLGTTVLETAAKQNLLSRCQRV